MAHAAVSNAVSFWLGTQQPARECLAGAVVVGVVQFIVGVAAHVIAGLQYLTHPRPHMKILCAYPSLGGVALSTAQRLRRFGTLYLNILPSRLLMDSNVCLTKAMENFPALKPSPESRRKSI